MTGPLKICSASTQNHGLKCTAPVPVASGNTSAIPPGDALEPDLYAAPCTDQQDFCGYDIDVWREVAEALNLTEGTDYKHVCLGKGANGFPYVIDSLAGDDDTYGACDIGVSGITATAERKDRGITFCRPIYRAFLSVLVHAHLERRGTWAFFTPLHAHVWFALVATVFLTPLLVFFLEAVFNKCTIYAKDGKIDIPRGLRECLWHSLSHTLSIDVFHVHSFSARIVVVAYAFLVLIITHTYTANLAAFLTVQRLDTSVRSIEDLRGKAVATIPTYTERLRDSFDIIATDEEGQDYPRIMDRLKAGEFAAFISGDTQLLPRAYADQSCTLHVLAESVAEFDHVFAFRRGFPSDPFITEVNRVLLDMQENRALEGLHSKHMPAPPRCMREYQEYSETNQVKLSAMWGLWLVMSGAVAIAFITAAIEFAVKHYHDHEDAHDMRSAVRVFATSISSRFGRRNNGGAQDPEAAPAGIGGGGSVAMMPQVHGPEPFLHGPKGGGMPWGASGGDSGAQRPRIDPTAVSAGPRLTTSGHSTVSAGCSSGSGGPPTLPHEFEAARWSWSAAQPDMPAHPSDPSRTCMLHSIGAANAASLSVHSTVRASGGLDIAVDDQYPLPAPLQGYQQARTPSSIELPAPPIGVTGAPPHAQHGSTETAQADAHAQVREFQSEVAEVMSMLRMVTQRVDGLQRPLARRGAGN
eukprot:jgi/Ulvmu1/6790/UM030_0128.1